MFLKQSIIIMLNEEWRLIFSCFMENNMYDYENKDYLVTKYGIMVFGYYELLIIEKCIVRIRGEKDQASRSDQGYPK